MLAIATGGAVGSALGLGLGDGAVTGGGDDDGLVCGVTEATLLVPGTEQADARRIRPPNVAAERHPLLIEIVAKSIAALTKSRSLSECTYKINRTGPRSRRSRSRWPNSRQGPERRSSGL